MSKRQPIDVPTLVTGITLTGLGGVAGIIALGESLVEPVSLWFAGVLLLAGFVGLFVSLARRPDRRC